MSQNAGPTTIASNQFGESTLQAFLASEIDAVMGITKTLRISHWNKAAEGLTGLTSEAAIGMSVLQVLPELQQSSQFAAFTSVIANGAQALLKDQPLFSGSGEKKYCSAACYPLFSGSGELTGGFALIRETLAPQHLSQRLNFAHRSLTLLGQYAQHLTCTISASGRLLQVNPLFESLLGYQASELIGKEALSFFHPDDLLAYKNGVINLPENPSEKPALHRFRHQQGHYLWFESIGITLRDPETQQVQELQVLAKPLPAHTIINQSARESGATFPGKSQADLVLAVTNTGAWSWNAATEMCTWDARTQQMFGLERGTQESTFSEFIALIHSEDRKQVKEAIRNTIASQEKFDILFRVLLEGNKQRYIHAVGGLLLLPDGTPDQILGLLGDVTDRREAEQKAREHEALLSSVFDSSLCGIALLDPVRDKTGQITDFQFRMINRLGAKTLGRTVQSLEGKYFLKEFPGTYQEGIFSAYVTVLETGEPSFLEKRYNHDGLNAWYAIQAAAMADSVTLNFTEITLLKESQQQLLEKQYFQEKVNQTSPLLVAVLNLHTRQCTYTNKPLSRFLNYSIEKQGAMGYAQLLDLLHPEDQGRLQPCLQQIASAPDYDVLRFQFRMRDRQEYWRWYQVFVKVFRRAAGGHVEEVLCMVQDIDEAEQNKHMLKSIFENSLNGIMAFEAIRAADGQIEDFRWVLINKPAEQLIGRRSRFVLGRRMMEVMPANFGKAAFQRFTEVIETGQAVQFEHYYSGNGCAAWFQVSAVKMEEGVAATFIDITKSKEAEIELRSSKLLNEKIVQTAPYFIGVFFLKTGELLYGNQRLGQILGYTDAEFAPFAQEHFQSVTHPDDLPRIAEHFARMAAAADEVVETETRLRAADGAWKWLRLCSTVFRRDAGGAVVEVLTIVSTLSDANRKSDQALHNAELAAGFCTWEADPDAGHFHPSDSFYSLLGYKQSEMQASPSAFLQLIHPDDLEEVSQLLQTNDSQPGPFSLECRMVSKNGSIKRFILQGRKMQGLSRRLTGIALDVTQLRNESRRSEIAREIKWLMDAIPLPAWTADSSGITDFVNSGWEQFTGQPACPLPKFAWCDLLQPDDKPAFLNKWLNAVKTGERFEHEAQVRNADGNYCWLLLKSEPMPGKGGQILKWFGTATNIQDRKQALAAQTKMQAGLQLCQAELNRNNELLRNAHVEIDTLIYLASHNLNAPISHIQSLLKNLQTEAWPENQRVQEVLPHIQKAIHQCRISLAEMGEVRLAKWLLTEPATSIGLGLLIEELKADLENLITVTAAEVDYDLEVPQVNFARHNLRSILFNLVSNALNYRYPERPPRVSIHTRLTPENEVLLTISDNGAGLSKEKLETVFKPNNREYTFQEGIEMSLHMVKRIMESGGGRIETESQEGVGTIVRIYLPGQ